MNKLDLWSDLNSFEAVNNFESKHLSNAIHNLFEDIKAQKEHIAELEKEIITSSKNSIATEILNVMEKEGVENFSIDVFKTDDGTGRDLQIACEYLDGKSVADTLKELEKERDIRDLEQRAKGVEDFFEEVDSYVSTGEPSKYTITGYSVSEEIENLRNQAKALREGEKLILTKGNTKFQLEGHNKIKEGEL